MKGKSIINSNVTDHMIHFGIGLGFLYWVIESLAHVFIFQDGTIFAQTFLPAPHELWMRSIVISIIILFAHYVQYTISHLKKAQDDSKLAYSELDQIFNTAADGMCVIARDFTILRINSTFLTISGLKASQIMGKKCHEVLNGPICHTQACPMIKIFEKSECLECDEEKVLPDGQKITCLITATPFRSPKGDLIGIVENLKDITERKRAEEELTKYRLHLEDLVKERTDELTIANHHLQREIIERKRTEHEMMKTNILLENIFAKVHFLLAYLDKNFNFIRVNRAYAETSLVDPNWLVGKNLFEMMIDQELEAIFRQAAKKEEPFFTFQQPFPFPRSSENEVTYWDWSLHPVKEKAGQVEGFILCLVNVTERKKAEDALRETEAKYSVLVERAKDGVLIVQREECAFVNKAFSMMLGYEISEILGRSILDFVEPEDREPLRNYQLSYLQGENSPGIFETKMRDKAGKRKEVEISTGFIQYRGKPASINIVRDITERNRSKEELQRAQKLESLGVLAGGIAHDFNNLLTAIIGNLSLIDFQLESDEDTTPALKEVERAAHQARGLTQQLLTFSKGGSPIKKVTTVAKIIKNTVNLALSGSMVKCDLSIPDNLWWTEIDEGQIGQVINNIIINAIQSMSGGGVIKVAIENSFVQGQNGIPIKAGKYIKIIISDRGIGIPKEQLLKIFDPYFSTKAQGTGLGLAISYSIIKKHEGYIAVESETGRGTTFSIYLPCTEKEVYTVRDIVNDLPAQGRGKILFMDDQKMIRDMAAQMLHKIGYEVKLTGDGQEAIEQYRMALQSGRPFDAVILDLTVPGGMGGKETLQKLRELNGGIKAIVSSGYFNDPIMANFKEYGFYGVVAKPYNLVELSNILQQVIND